MFYKHVLFLLMSHAVLVLAMSLTLIGQNGQTFHVVREKVLSFDMLPQAVGPYRSTPYTQKSGIVWRQRIMHPVQVSAIRVHVTIQRTSLDLRWKLLFKDLSDLEVDRLNADEVHGTEFWSDEIPGSGAILEMWSDTDPSAVQIVADQYAYVSVPSFPQAITGNDGRLPIWTPLVAKRIRDWGTPVARLRFMMSGGRQASCTAFLVAADLLLTNDHCIQSEAEAASAVADFAYDNYSSIPERIRVRKLELGDSGLDYALLRLNTAAQKYSKVHLDRKADLADKSALLIIQHPAGEPKQVSIADCIVNGPHRSGNSERVTDFGHLCDTLGGSSGSPVLDINTGAVVGLHHLGFTEGNPDPVNQAVYLGPILDDIRQRNSDLFQEITSQ